MNPTPNSIGFFRTQNIDGRWWLVDPEGRPFLSKGVAAVRFSGDRVLDTDVFPFRDICRSKYGNEAAWQAATEERLFDWGFNTLGAWSDPGISGAARRDRCLAHAPILNLGAGYVTQQQKGEAWLHGIFPDVFSEGFEQYAFKAADGLVAEHKNNPWVLGWFTDNELRWGPDWRGSDELLTLFLALSSDSAGKRAAVEHLRSRYAGIKEFNEVWRAQFQSWDELLAAASVQCPYLREALYMQNQGTERVANESDPQRAAFFADCESFLGVLAERYFDVTSRALKSADPNHLNFGCRFAYVPPDPVIEAAARHLDVVSFNCYELDPSEILCRYSAFGKPLMIGEFSFRGEDSGLPNTKGAGPWVKTQADRAAAFEKFVTTALSNPFFVGYHWFKFSDQPKEGRFDGENSNYGIVTIHDEVYEPLADTMRKVNERAEEIHWGSPRIEGTTPE
jgi:agarase